MTDHMKPCPFCGNSADVYTTLLNRYYMSRAVCDSCQATGEYFKDKDPLESGHDAIRAWNQRYEIELPWIDIRERPPSFNLEYMCWIRSSASDDTCGEPGILRYYVDEKKWLYHTAGTYPIGFLYHTG